MAEPTTPAAPTPAAPPPVDDLDEADERRTLVWAAVAFFGVLALMVVGAVLLSGDAGDPRTTTASTEACAPDDAACEAARAAAVRPGIIPEPGSGRAPDDAGDPGGALQVAVLVLIVLGLVAIVALVARSGRTARRAAAAAASDPAPPSS